jgi:hypothetical protein
MKELYLLMEEEEINAQHPDNKACTGDSWTQNTVRPHPSLVLPYPFPPSICDHFLSPSNARSALGTGPAEDYCLVTGPQLLSAMRYISYFRTWTKCQK